MSAQKKSRQKRQVITLPQEQVDKLLEESGKRVQSHPEIFNLPKSIRSIDDLADYLSRSEEGSKRILPKEKRRYVIYLRKSTDDESKQIRSLDDQRAECLEMANHLQISIRDEDIFEESESAKKSGQRPIFDEVLKGFMTGKYHGLISWSPDRLSRNMKEAGEIIEMIDMEFIQDLQFCTYSFENTPNGKMMLGILFATSKQYSDKLSVDVSRGITGNIKDGKYTGQSKRGYYVDKGTGYFLPDEYNWNLLREAANMRIHQGKANPEIADFLNGSKLSIRKDQDSEYRLSRVDKKSVGDIFADPFYFGLYKYGDNLADLTQLYNFLPLITPDEYILLNQKTAADFNKEYVGRSQKNSKRLEYGLLNGKVICDYCDKVMQFQHQEIKRGKNKGRWLISYYCRNKDCLRHNPEEQKAQGIKLAKSIRAKYVTAHIEWTLRHCTKKSKKAYKMHIDRLELKIAQDKAIARRKLQESKSELRKNEAQYMKYQNFQLEHPDDYKKHHEGKLEYHQNLINIAQNSIDSNKTELKKLEADLPTEEEFYELMNSYLKTLLNTKDLLEEDAIYNELVLNLRAGNDSVSVIKLNPPYNLMVDLSKVSIGRG